MKKILIAVFALTLFAACGENTRSEETGVSYQKIDIPSPSLTNALIGEVATQTIGVYLPPGYDEGTNRYPVLYFLAGHSGFATGLHTWLRFDQKMDTLIEYGKISPYIVVLVDGYNKFLGSFYVNSPLTGNWEDFLVKDVTGYIDQNYRTLASSEYRGIAGHSMGGYGALNTAMLYPDAFGSVYALSPGLFDEEAVSNWQVYAGDLTEIISRFETDVTDLGIDEVDRYFELYYDNAATLGYDAFFAIGYGSAFAYNLDRDAPYFDFPYKKEGDEIVVDEAVWAKWYAGFGGCEAEATEYYDNWMKLSAIKVDYGNMDEYQWIPEGCRYFGAVMSNAGIPVEVEEYNGTHGGYVPMRIKNKVLPYFSEIFFGE